MGVILGGIVGQPEDGEACIGSGDVPGSESGVGGVDQFGRYACGDYGQFIVETLQSAEVPHGQLRQDSFAESVQVQNDNHPVDWALTIKRSPIALKYGMHDGGNIFIEQPSGV